MDSHQHAGIQYAISDGIALGIRAALDEMRPDRLSVREQYAIAALHCLAGSYKFSGSDAAFIAEDAFRIADAMVEAEKAR